MNNEKHRYERLDPDDLDLGDEETSVQVRHPVGLVVSVRLSAEEADQLERIAEVAGKSVVDVAREAVQATIAAGTLPTRSSPEPLRAP